ncbi:patatin-like phospholipase family protein [uncultured Roseobacter sp.]|uniref:patatin-like phospholipase family protein n=1 Tax=uncultured Roseobacter sp. TaxID=114847 RepID=UPI002603895D|nr:patatin-like phospholipase family protein [uncultured Roseobacter sp.]
MEFDVVFQGGGSKIFPMLAGVKSVQDKVAQTDMTLGSIAGASAGAIAALCLALGFDNKKLREFLCSPEGASLAKKAFPDRWAATSAARLALGKTYYDEAELRQLIWKICEHFGFKDKKKRLKLDVSLFFAITNLKSSQLEFNDQNGLELEQVVQNVCDSCAIPFVFKSHKSKFSWEYVDGGLFENFPVSSLVKAGGNPARIIGFSFQKPETSSSETGLPTFGSYLGRLVATAIDANLEHSLSQLPKDNVFVIDAPLGTLEFKKGLTTYIHEESHYNYLEKSISVWLNTILERERQISHRLDTTRKALIPSSFEGLMTANGRLFDSKSNAVYDKRNVTIYMQINSIGSPENAITTDYDFLFTRIVYDVPEHGMECVLVLTHYHNTAEAGLLSDFDVRTSSGDPVSFVALPLVTELVPKDFVGLGLFFDRKLMRSDTETIVVIKKEFIKDCMIELKTEGVDYLELAQQIPGKIDSASMYIGIPDEVSGNFELGEVGAPYDESSKGFSFINVTKIDDCGEVEAMRGVGVEVRGYQSDSPILMNSMMALRISKAN